MSVLDVWQCPHGQPERGCLICLRKLLEEVENEREAAVEASLTQLSQYEAALAREAALRDALREVKSLLAVWRQNFPENATGPFTHCLRDIIDPALSASPTDHDYVVVRREIMKVLYDRAEEWRNKGFDSWADELDSLLPPLDEGQPRSEDGNS